MKTFLATILLVLAAQLPLKSQIPELSTDPDFQEATRSAIDSLYNRNPEAARVLLASWTDAWPDHPFWLLWDGMELWWEVLNDISDDSRDRELFSRMEQADRAAVRLLGRDASNIDAHVIRAVANGYIARQHANRHRWVQSVRTARNAQQAHAQLNRLVPDLPDNRFAEGLKLYYSAYLPDAYPVVRAVAWLLPDGDREEGIRLLEQTSREAVFARPEAIYFLGNILLNYEQDYDAAVDRFVHLAERYPNNSYYRRLLVRTLFRQERYRDAETEISRALQHWESHRFADAEILQEELLYWRGRILMRSGRYGAALEDLEKSYRTGENLPNRSERSFHALSGYYAGLASEWSGDTASAREYYRQVSRLDCEPDLRRRARNRLSEL